ncbi:MAG: disulfide bond formation protein B [Burkholderia sp.]|nr:disulfide bond formation protein B [Burkholderia sp.]
MNDFYFSIRCEHRFLKLLGFFCIMLLAGALYLQYVQHEDPCPLCVLQRYFFALIAIFSFIATGMKRWRWILLFESLIALSALAGGGIAAHHLVIQLNPGFSCNFDVMEKLVDSLPFTKLLPWIFEVKDEATCDIVYPAIIGIPLPGWALLSFALILIIVLISIWRHRNQFST